MAFAQSSAQRARPGTVTLAGYAGFALAAVQLISALGRLLAAGPTAGAIRDYGAEVGDADAAGAAATAAQVAGYIAVAIGVLFAIGFAVLALFLGRGSNAARITAWVVLGLSACCGVLGLAGTAVGNVFSNS